jgi:hypothetical protein
VAVSPPLVRYSCRVSSSEVLHDLEHLRATLDVAIASVVSGALPFAELLALDDDDRTYLYVVKALEAVDGVGKVRARRILDSVGLPEDVRFSELTSLQRKALLGAIG